MSANQIERDGSLGFEHLAGALGAASRQTGGIEQSDLHQNAGLVPVDVLMPISTRFPVGGTPGRSQSIGIVWVKLSCE